MKRETNVILVVSKVVLQIIIAVRVNYLNHLLGLNHLMLLIILGVVWVCLNQAVVLIEFIRKEESLVLMGANHPED